MEAKQQETAMEEGINLQQEDFVELDDLRLTDEELDGINGGSDDGEVGVLNPDGRPSGGGWISNHNETTVSDD